MGSNRDWIGVKQPVREWQLSATRTEAYARATDDSNARYFRHSGLAPPMAVVTGTLPHALAPLLQDEAFIGDRSRFLKLLHAEEDIRWFAPIGADETLSMVTTVTDIDDKSVGEFVSFETEVRGSAGQRLATSLTTTVIRDPKPPEDRIAGTRKSVGEPTLSAADRGQPILVDWTVAEDQSLRYADASGDRNPIHLSDETAREAGLKGKILHGLCTMAFAQRVVVDTVCSGDPSRLRRLRVRFARPVFMGDRLTCALQPVAISGHYRVTVLNQEGIAVLREGITEVSLTDGA